MKPATIKTILQERKKEMEKYLARSLRDQKDMRKEKHLPHAHDMLESLSHQIGYMTGAIEQTSEHLRMLEISDKEYWAERKATEEHNRNTMGQLRSMFKERKMAKAK